MRISFPRKNRVADLPDRFYAHAASSKHTSKSKVHFSKTCPTLAAMYHKADDPGTIVIEDVEEKGTLVNDDNSCQRCKRAEEKAEAT
jgi:hypothetical protein